MSVWCATANPYHYITKTKRYKTITLQTYFVCVIIHKKNRILCLRRTLLYTYIFGKFENTFSTIWLNDDEHSLTFLRKSSRSTLLLKWYLWYKIRFMQFQWESFIISTKNLTFYADVMNFCKYLVAPRSGPATRTVLVKLTANKSIISQGKTWKKNECWVTQT